MPLLESLMRKAAAYYNDIFDVFDVVQEVELELDGILFPKYYIVEC